MLFRVSVSLRSYIHSYELDNKVSVLLARLEFSSPYGVSFIHSFLLFLLFYFNCFILSMGFRLLTEYHSFLRARCLNLIRLGGRLVSVSLRSYIHSYHVLQLINGLSDNNTSVSLWSIIHSYSLILSLLRQKITSSFRLLTELYSFLL